MTKLQRIIVVNLMTASPTIDASATSGSHITIHRVDDSFFNITNEAQNNATLLANEIFNRFERLAITSHKDAYDFNRCRQIAQERCKKWRQGSINFAQCISCDLLDEEDF